MLSGEKLLSIAERENQSNIQTMCDLLFGMADVCFFLLIVLPLYPNTVDGYIYSVPLFAYTEITAWIRGLYWILFFALLVLFLAMTRQVYAIVVAFLLLIIKGMLLFKYVKVN